MPVNESESKWDILPADNWGKVLSTTTTSTISTSGSDWATVSVPTDWATVSVPTTTTDSYIWTTSTTPITAGSSTITITYPPDHEYEFPFLDTYNLESPRGREKYLTALRNYLNFYFCS